MAFLESSADARFEEFKILSPRCVAWTLTHFSADRYLETEFLNRQFFETMLKDLI